jgi:hypothetical protein
MMICIHASSHSSPFSHSHSLCKEKVITITLPSTLPAGEERLNQGVPEEEARFAAFFEQATDHDPYPFQKRLATGEQLPELIDVPTGMGKTDAVVLAWLWRRRFAGPEVREATPRRLAPLKPARFDSESNLLPISGDFAYVDHRTSRLII